TDSLRWRPTPVSTLAARREVGAIDEDADFAPRSTGLFEIEVDGLGAAGVAQLAKCAGFDLADPLTCHSDTLADLLQAVLSAVDQPVAELDDPTLPRVERGQDRPQRDSQQGRTARLEGA